MLISLWKQAEDGKVPVSGAGYRGPFTGTGFDSMWTDMSEIVRPTRDGIHGREYISTSVDLGRRLSHLTFDGDGRLASKVPDTVDLPIPILFDTPEEGLSWNVRAALVKAAGEIGTCVILPAAGLTSDGGEYSGNIIPLLAATEIEAHRAVLGRARLVAIEYSDAVLGDFPALREKIRECSHALTIIRVPVMKRALQDIVNELARNGAEVIHIVADYSRSWYRRPGRTD
jgi:hypothetical protein